MMVCSCTLYWTEAKLTWLWLAVLWLTPNATWANCHIRNRLSITRQPVFIVCYTGYVAGKIPQSARLFCCALAVAHIWPLLCAGFHYLFTTAKKGAGYAVHFNPPFNPLQLRSLRLFPFSVPPASGCFLPILQTAFDALFSRACRLHSADKFICRFNLLPPCSRVLGRAVRKRIYPPQESTLWAHKIPKSFLKTLF